MGKKQNYSVVILAAGLGTRMKIDYPKVFQPILGVPMISEVVRAAAALNPARILVVVGQHRRLFEEWRQKNPTGKKNIPLFLVDQKPQLGTAHALMMAEPYLKKSPGFLVLPGDVPLINKEILSALVARMKNSRPVLAGVILTAVMDNPTAYGRIIEKDNRIKIVEEKDATAAERQIKEINSGIYYFRNSPDFWEALHKIRNDNSKKEYYLTDIVEILSGEGKKIVREKISESEAVFGVNTFWDLARAERIKQLKIIQNHCLAGVRIINPETVYIEAAVRIGPGTVIWPNNFLIGKTIIGRDCFLGPGNFIADSRIGAGAEIRASFLYEVRCGQRVKIGPFAHLRPKTIIQDEVRVGNFSEIKKSVVGRNTKISHLAYIGDAHLGKDINIGAGAITCNFDGQKKHPTYIGDGSFIGSNVNLVAPVRIGKKSLVGAGSTITRNVGDHTLAIARQRQVNLARKK